MTSRLTVPSMLGKPFAAFGLTGAVLIGSTLTAVTQAAHADVEQDKKVAYLIGVTMRPGYDFADAGEALNYGYGICGKISQKVGYARLISEVQGDFNTSDDYHASYLISQAVNELCPELIWQLRNSASHNRPPAGTSP